MLGLGINEDVALGFMLSDPFQAAIYGPLDKEQPYTGKMPTEEELEAFILTTDDIINNTQSNIVQAKISEVFANISDQTNIYSPLNKVLKLNKGIKDIYSFYDIFSAAATLNIIPGRLGHDSSISELYNGITEGFNKHYSSQFLLQMMELEKISSKIVMMTSPMVLS